MNCCQCEGIEETFGEETATRDLQSYREQGPSRTTRMLLDALKREAPAGIGGMTILDIGGGVGAIQVELLRAGASTATDVDASSAYLRAAKQEAERQGLAERITHRHGNFVALAPDIAPADIVTLDRVICCYDDMHRLVDLSAARARKLYGVVYPRDTWWIRIGSGIANLFCRLQRSPFRLFVHPTQAVNEIVASHGLKQRFYGKTFIWQIVVYAR